VNNGGLFANSGQVTITNTGLFTTSTNYAQSAGSTQVNGTLTTTNGAMMDIQGGTLSGGGTISSNLVMGGTLMAGTPGNPFQLNIDGDYTQTGSGTFTEGISSTANGMLNVSGAVVLDLGALLNIQLADGFDPRNGASFFILDYGSETGTFTISDPFFNNGTQEWVITSYAGGDGDDIVLTAEAAVPVATPEPSTILLLGAGLLGMFGYAKKKTTAGV
jgi:PEP-CTERM motif